MELRENHNQKKNQIFIFRKEESDVFGKRR